MSTAKLRKNLFVIQPFGKGSEPLFQLIAAAASTASISAVRADSVIGLSTASVSEEIEKAIAGASLVVADVTEGNPNVMYEVGLAQAKNKPLILIASSSRSIPFDLGRFRVVIYDATNPEDFVSRLGRMIGEAAAQPSQFRAERAAAAASRAPNVFISYSHTDTEFLDRLLVHLKPLEKSNQLELWVDTRLRAGDKWRREIEKALERANVAILLVSADFLASDFITENELPPLLKNAEERGTRVVPLIVKPCRFMRDKNLRVFQSVNDPKKALILLPSGQQELIYDQVAAEVEKSVPSQKF
jgi:hypothetical protein